MPCHITKQLVHSFSVNIWISQPSKVMFTSAAHNINILRLTNPDVNLKRIHQLYSITYMTFCYSKLLLKTANRLVTDTKVAHLVRKVKPTISTIRAQTVSKAFYYIIFKFHV